MSNRAPVDAVLRDEAGVLSYRIRGAGPPVVFIQGVGLHGDGWLPQVAGLEGEMACLTYDHRGMGASGPPPRTVRVEALAREVHALMDDAGWRSAHLVGHSLGALVALEAAALDPARTRSVALLCSVLRGRDATRLSLPILRFGIAAYVGTKRRARSAFLRLILPSGRLEGADTERLAAEFVPYFGHDLADRPRAVDGQLAALRRYDATERAARVAGVPALVVSAAEDPIAPPRFGRALHAALPGATFVLIDEAAHGVTITHADAVNTLLRNHIGGAERTRARTE